MPTANTCSDFYGIEPCKESPAGSLRRGNAFMKLKAVVIGWEGKEERASTIALHLRNHVDSVRLTYSTRGGDIVIPEVEGIRVPSESYFGWKFEHSIRQWNDEAMLLVHADTSASDWSELVSACSRALDSPPIKLWSPEIDVTPWPTALVQFDQSSTSSYLAVVHTDAIVLGLAPDVVQRLRRLDYRGNNLGWGMDWVALCYTYANNGIAVRDRSVSIRHDAGSGYSPQDASRQMGAFLQQMTLTEQIQHRFLQLAIQTRRQAWLNSRHE